ncbi:HAMP domain-containing sensor histidine kinase [Phenylobacterium sp. VNQ135]|uniref:sensor histidine kinase n=1 Tax=Phenylobacterium sp. VNQ135 TaxID=3400922 RepID=UPI003C0C0FDE
MIAAAKAFLKRRWPAMRLRDILLAVFVFTAAMPGIAAISLRVYENTLVRQTEAELVAQGAALAALAAAEWPGAPAAQPRPSEPPADYFRPEPTTIDLSRSPVLPERPAPVRAGGPVDPSALSVGAAIAPVVERTTRTTLASVLLLDARGRVAMGLGRGGDLSSLPEVRAALGGHPRTVFRRNGDYHPQYRFEWLSRASALRLHHARPVVVGDRVVGVLLLSRSPRALFRGLYEDRGKILIGIGVIFGVLVVMAGLVSRGVTRPIEELSAASRQVAAGGGAIPETPPTAAVEIRALYEDFRAMAERIERRSRYLRDFAAAVSHEFKTPLAGIGGAVELLQDHLDTMSAAERRRFLDNIAADADRLSQLVTRLLDLARADMAEPEAGVAADLAAPIARAADGEAGPGFAVEVRTPADLPPVSAPAETIEKVVAILLQNARQAGAGRGSVTAETTDDAVILVVSDDGPGVAGADRERLFEPFFTGRRAQGGTGLGLPIARSLLAASHGRLELLETERGAAFRITVPRAGA